MAKMRYRKPSVKTLLGVTKWKKRAKKALGINKVLAPFRAVNNYKRRALRQAGYYNPEMKMMRAMKRGQAPGPIGPLQVGEGDDDSGDKGKGSSALLMAAMLAQGDSDKKDDDANPLLMAAMMGQGNDGPNLAEAMMLSAMTKDSDEKHARKAKHARAEDASDDDRPRARRSKAKSSDEEEEPKPKRRRGLRLFGLLLVVLLEAAAILNVWYFWIA
ncbi:MAG TPA: hypothetical protein VH599_16300 [Ktedonobacterales bacterium]|jgi:hypothetical protein